MALTQRAHDTFTDADLTVIDAHTPDQGSGWQTASGSAFIFTNALASNGSGTWIARNLTTLQPIQAAEATLHSGSANGYVFTRSGVGPDGYCFFFGSGAFARILRCDDGSFTTLASNDPAHPAQGDVCRLEANGTGLTALVNGSSVLTATDSTYATGLSGLGFDIPFNGALDDFFAYDDDGSVPPAFAISLFKRTGSATRPGPFKPGIAR